MTTAQKDLKVKKPQDDNQAPAKADTGSLVKEQEPVISFEDEAKIVAEIQDRSESLDREAIERVRAEIPETKQAMPEPELAPDLEDAGVVNPQKEADQVIAKGASLNLPISEDEYKQGLQIKFKGKTFDKSFVGVSSFIAFSMWVGRLIKMAHKHAMKIVFRKSSFATSSAEAMEVKKASADAQALADRSEDKGDTKNAD